MAVVLITDVNGVVLREYEVPPTTRIECNPGERVIFIDTSIEAIGLKIVGDADVAIIVENFAGALERFTSILEAGEDVELLF